MALTRRMLKALGIEDEKVDEIIAAHAETVDALKGERDEAKARAAESDDLRRKLDEANGKLADAQKDDWQAKYEQEHSDFEAYKAEEAKKVADAEKAKAYRAQVLGAAKIDPKRLDQIMRLVDLDSFEVDDKGVVKDAEKLAQGAAKEWSAFVVETGQRGAKVDEPPGTGNANVGDPVAQRIVAQRMAQYGVKTDQQSK